MIRRRYYGWWDEKDKVFRLSLVPPDCPVRPSLALETKAEADEWLRRKRGDVYWWPPLPGDACSNRRT